ncbi:MAG: tetratricopeptide repeat protein [Muribaculaceae bacterium]|nr:tetratricopeptide repeat protein [Muribaculaceae bacterium]
MKKTLVYVSLGAVVLAMGSCSKKVGDFASEYFTTNPTPLETVGETVPATISGTVPAKFMPKNAVVTVTPVLAWDGGEASSSQVTFQGENARANGQVISYANGGPVTIPFNVKYQPEMANSDLYLDFKVNQGGKDYELPRVKVGYGVVATSTLTDVAVLEPAPATSNFERIIKEQYSAEIKFLINQANIRANQVDAADYIDLNKELMAANDAPNKEIAGVNVHSYASPDGTMEFNTQLAEKREVNTVDYMRNQLKKDKITEFGELTSEFTPEDWEGFQQLVEKSNIQDKNLILSVLKMYKDPEQREQEIRNMSAVFNELAEQILPQLRYSKIVATVNVIGKSDEELLTLVESTPNQLNIEEILYAATLVNDDARKAAIYAAATQLFPNDFRAWNGLGATQFSLGNYDAASKALAQAKKLAPNDKSVEFNQGLIALANNNLSQAKDLIGGAAGVPEAAAALGVLYLNEGQVSNAVSNLSGVKDNNAALAQILSKDYSAAKNTLAAIQNPNANTYYLAAIVGARTNNENMVLTNLREAIKLDNSLLAKAQKDLEFASYNLAGL